MSPSKKPANDTKEVVKLCAIECLEPWEPDVVAKPCGEVATEDSAIVLLLVAFADIASDRISDVNSRLLQEPVDRSGPDDQRRRITSTRAARLARHAAVAANKNVRSSLGASSETAAHKKPDSEKNSSTKAPVALPKQAAQPADTPKSKSFSEVSKTVPDLPTFIPSSCGVPGSSCGGVAANPGPGRVLERKIGAEQEGLVPSSPPAIKREAESYPAAEARPFAAAQAPDKVPSSCGFAGGTCGASGASDGSGSGGVANRETDAEQEGITPPHALHKTKPETKRPSPPAQDPRQRDEHPPGWTPSSCGFAGSSCGGGTGPASMPPVHVKREAESQPVAEALSSSGQPPVYMPSSCTMPGVTCGLSKGSGKGPETGPPAPYNDWGLVHTSRRPNASDSEGNSTWSK
jgi:hypothetical protein